VDTRCVLCGGAEALPEAVGYDFEYNTAENAFRFVRCTRCAHVYLNPRPSPADLGVIYPSSYYTLSGPGGLVQRMQRVWEGRKVSVYENALGPGKKRILDVGCGDGRFLQVLHDFGSKDWELVGVDFDPAAVERCRARGLTATLIVPGLSAATVRACHDELLAAVAGNWAPPAASTAASRLQVAGQVSGQRTTG